MTLKIACVFPGQGSQQQGMLSEWSDNPIVRQTFEEASDALGYDVWDLIQNNPDNKLNQTEWTQPAMLVADIAAFRVFHNAINTTASPSTPLSISIKFMAGHSLGEYAALVAAGSVTLKDAAILVRHRGRLMQSIIPEGSGSMAAIVGLTDEEVITLCQNVAQSIGPHIVLEAANFNSVGQVVIAGDTEAVDKAITAATDAGARLAKVIPVSVPCHCKLLFPVAEASLEYLQAMSISCPQVPVIHNVHADMLNEPEEIRAILRQQLYEPVQWVATVRKIAASEVHTLVECGPGSVLTGLNKRIDKSLRCLNVSNPETLAKTLQALQEN